MPYRYLRPKDSNSLNKFPLVIFLHGANAKGFDNEAQLNEDGRFFLRDSIRENYPSYVLFPQCPERDLWAFFEIKTDAATGSDEQLNFPFNKKPTETSMVLMRLIDSLVHSDEIDAHRIYIGGLYQGGNGGVGPDCPVSKSIRSGIFNLRCRQCCCHKKVCGQNVFVAISWRCR